jgi:hypothetical protein
MPDYDDLVNRSKTGEVTPAELAMLKAELAAEPMGPNRHAILYVLGRSFDASRKGVGRTLPDLSTGSDDDLVCATDPGQLWGLAGDYRDYVIEFLRGVSWDREDGGYVRQMALSVAGDHLRDNRDPEMLREMLAVADDPRDEFGEWDELMFGIVVQELGSALGYESRDLMAPSGGSSQSPPH